MKKQPELRKDHMKRVRSYEDAKNSGTAPRKRRRGDPGNDDDDDDGGGDLTDDDMDMDVNAVQGETFEMKKHLGVWWPIQVYQDTFPDKTVDKGGGHRALAAESEQSPWCDSPVGRWYHARLCRIV